MIAFVIDTSVAAAFAFKEDHPLADQALAWLVSEEAIVPALFWFELRNVLVVNERRRRISEAETVVFLRRLDRMRIAIDREPVESDVLALARSHRLSVYDAVYLELARRRMTPLLTLDKLLVRAAAAEGLPGDSR